MSLLVLSLKMGLNIPFLGSLRLQLASCFDAARLSAHAHNRSRYSTHRARAEKSHNVLSAHRRD